MVCTLCLRFSSAPKIEGDCFDHLATLLKEHYTELEGRKNKEIEELKERLYRLEARNISESTPINSSSPTLFTQDFALAEDPHSISTDIFNMTVQDVELKQPLRGKRPSPLIRPRKNSQFKSPKHTGNWKSKPTRLSFSKLELETQVGLAQPPKKQMKALTIQESFFRGAKPKVEGKKRSIESVDLVEGNGEGEGSTKLQTPTKTKENKDPDPLEGFCDDCTDYFRLNPPRFNTDRDRLKKLQECKVHKLQKYRLHETPPGFWKIDFGATPEQMKTQVARKEAK